MNPYGDDYEAVRQKEHSKLYDCVQTVANIANEMDELRTVLSAPRRIQGDAVQGCNSRDRFGRI